jgi:TonB family protein
MKLLLAASVAAALAVGVTPAALAEANEIADARAFTRAGLTPIVADSPRYPVRAERALEEGVCTVRFDIAADGAVTNAEPLACTSWDFEREALRVVSTLRYPERAGGAAIEAQEITFRWLGQTSEE